MDQQRHRLTITALIAILSLIAVSCAEDDPALEETTQPDEMATMDEDEHTDDEEDEHADFAFGEPADAASADRVIEIEALDAFAFDPSEITIETGETVTFRVTNTGAIPHDFTLGDEAVQDEHEAEMAEMGEEMEMHDEPNLLALEPGETKEMTWHFTQAGEILIGCHQPGHYDAGMKATVTVEG